MGKPKRANVTETQRLLSGTYDRNEISEHISILQELQKQGWEYVTTDKEWDGDCEYFQVNVTRQRPETDEEYNKRLEQLKFREDSARRQYEALKARFENLPETQNDHNL